MDFVGYLEVDVVLAIMVLLCDPIDLIRVAAVSRSWYHFVLSHRVCKRVCLEKAPQLHNISRVIVKGRAVRYPSDAESDDDINLTALKRDHNMYSSFLRALATSVNSHEDCTGSVIGASSTDRGLDSCVVHSRFPFDRYDWGSSYWSSKGHTNPDVSECLLFKLNDDMCVVSEIIIRPFQAFWEHGSPVFSAMSVRFQMGHSIAETNLNPRVRNLLSQHLDDSKYIWTYVSPEFPMAQEYFLQPFRLPKPTLCIGGVLKIELLGLAQIDPSDGLYYTRVGYVKVMGRPLGFAFDLSFRMPRELILTYCHDYVDYVMQDSSHVDSMRAPGLGIIEDDVAHADNFLWDEDIIDSDEEPFHE